MLGWASLLSEMRVHQSTLPLLRSHILLGQQNDNYNPGNTSLHGSKFDDAAHPDQFHG